MALVFKNRTFFYFCSETETLFEHLDSLLTIIELILNEENG